MKARERLVALVILSAERHCDNSCDGMSIDAQRCDRFDQHLVWDKRKKKPGNKRVEACIKAEQRAHPL